VETAVFRTLRSPAGQEALQAAAGLAPREQDFLAHFNTLSKRFPAELARAALEIAILRNEAVRKFPFADRLFFTREALEQASSWEISTHRLLRYRGFSHLIDLGCSVGGDTLALAQVATTTGIDRDPLRLAMACANVHALGLNRQASFVRADLNSSLPLFPSRSSTALFFDPARRSQGKRAYSVRSYQPPLGIIRAWLSIFPALGVKISPGVKLEELGEYDGEIEFISLGGDLKEAVLWHGPLKSARRRATLLPGGHTLTEADNPADRLLLDEPRPFLYEPDPAVLRAGLVAALGVKLNAVQLDADIAYLTGEHRIETPFARLWAVEAWFPFQLKRLRAYLRERSVGRIIVKKRGSPLEPEALISSLKLSGEGERTVFLTHLRGKPIVIIGLPP
jgi:hypothetical protein